MVGQESFLRFGALRSSRCRVAVAPGKGGTVWAVGCGVSEGVDRVSTMREELLTNDCSGLPELARLITAASGSLVEGKLLVAATVSARSRPRATPGCFPGANGTGPYRLPLWAPLRALIWFRASSTSTASPAGVSSDFRDSLLHCFSLSSLLPDVLSDSTSQF